MKLDDIRIEIDKIDKQLVPLLKERMNCSIKVAEIKKAEGLPIYHPGREQAILDKVNDMGGEFGSYISAIYREIMGVSKEAQQVELTPAGDLAGRIVNAKDGIKENVTVACQGVAGAFGNIAAKNLHKTGTIKYYATFEDVFKAVENDEAVYGVVPVENSNAGSVMEVYDLILKYRFYIVSAAELAVNENLLGQQGATLEDIKTVCSHPQALAQSEEFIKEHNITPVQYSNTALAAKFVAEKGDKTVAAIGSALAGSLYGLKVIASNIQTVKHNSTRFITISKQLIIPDEANKVSVVFSVPHSVGALNRVLNRFCVNGLNLTKIESRAARNGNFDYVFYLDFAGTLNDRKTIALISSLADELPDFTFLGNYREEAITE
ncbi:MAG: prephenate dehydratase domain-containing protein [Acutalibacteraceae bacterium]|nr:prephenate dehydratase domain-containing protein [Acutalibacteraceae bacterium]